MALNANDSSIFLAVVQAWKSKPNDTTDLDAFAQTAINSLQQKMSGPGFVSLMSHLRSEKKNMKRIPAPNMTQHSH
ncbi:MAG: hypothetical protein JO307_04800 [Bryobacterales bacterium]|nr:hypothetical protein [Bryobacterales bacterium]